MILSGVSLACSRSTPLSLYHASRICTPVGLQPIHVWYLRSRTCRYGANEFDGYGGDSDDNYFYFGDEEQNYYETYAVSSDGYGYDYSNHGMSNANCIEDGSGEVKLPGVHARPSVLSPG